MANLGNTSEELVAEIQELHEILEENHVAFAEALEEIIEAAQEVYVREEMVKGMTAAATPACYHLDTGVITVAPDDGSYFITVGSGGGAGGVSGPDDGGGRGGLGRGWTWTWN
jgi:hypothetical protein